MIALLQKLIQIPSENNGVTGYEKQIQRFYHDWLKEHGIPAEWIEPETILGFDQHPARLLKHDIRNRPLVIARMQGKRLGKKHLLLAHADTVLARKSFRFRTMKIA